MSERAPLRIRQFVIDAQDYEALAHFWQNLLGWPTVQHWPDERWISIPGGTKLDQQDDKNPAFRVYADPAGHPFCLEFGFS